MNIQNPIYIVKTYIVAATILLANAAWAQSGTDLFHWVGYAGLRHVDINQITTTDFLCDSSYFYLNTDSVSDDWILNEKAIYEYDNQGRESIRYISAFNEGEWIREQQIRSTYTSDFLSVRQNYSWNELENQWTPHTRYNYNYNYIGLVNEIKTLNFKDSKWNAESKTNYTYSANYLIEIEAHYVWNNELNIWSPDSRSLYEYNEVEDVTKEVFQVWAESINDWVNKTSEIYKFDDSDNLVSSTKRVWDNLEGSWINNIILSIEYNSEGLPLRSAVEVLDSHNNAMPSQTDLAEYDDLGNIDQLLTSYWDDESGSWDVYQKQINFWSKYIQGNLDTAEKEIRCVFANPYTIGLPWYCNSLKPDVLYTLKVYDLYGRTFYTDQFLGSSTFRITQHLEPGYYIFEISGGLDKHYEKVYVKS